MTKETTKIKGDDFIEVTGKIKRKKDHLAELYNSYDIPEWFSHYDLAADYNTVYLEGRPISIDDFVELLQLSE